MPVKKEIIYPIFLECCQYADDNFWVNIFEDLAYGKTPYGTYINKNFLSCSYKNKEFSYKIIKKDPKEIYNDIYNLLTKKLGILSKQEKIKKRLDFHKTETKIKERRQEWSKIKKKNVKELLIERYVVNMKNMYNLSIKQSRYLLSIIFISLIFKVITNQDIEFCNSKIVNINGIEFSDKKIHIKREIYDTDIKFSSEINDDKKIMSENWEKYLNNLRKSKNSLCII